jgi:uncharacterized delta-60 repeat protein
MKRSILILLITVSLFRTSEISAQQGSLDITFGEGGKVKSKFSSIGNNYGTCTAIQKDGKLIVGGSSWLEGYEFTLIRYLTNGTIDSTFGTNGITVNTAFGNQSYGMSLKIQDDGRIILAGSAYDGFSRNSFAIARYTPNGQPDYSFGFASLVTTHYPDGYIANASPIVSLAIQNDGKYLLGGNLSYGSSIYFSLLRYNTNGQIDISFGSNGWAVTKFNSIHDTFDYGTTVLVQADNKILLTGYATQDFLYHFAIARYNTNGTPDSSFGINGQVLTNFNGKDAYAYSAVVQPDNKILLAGTVYNNSSGPGDFALARYQSNGKPDSSFGVKGLVTTPLDKSSSSSINGITLQPDGKILCGGWATGDFALVRYNTNGRFDSSFGVNGQVYTDFGTEYDFARAIALENDGKIILVGDDGGFNIQLARYNGENLVLPINLLSFTATKKDKEAILKWTTAPNSINTYFVVQRSLDGVHFINVGKVNASANGIYSFTDNLSALTYQPTSIYFRLQAFEANGEFTYSPIKNIGFNDHLGVAVFPNPVKANINMTISADRNEKAEIQIIDVQGKIVFQTQTDIVAGTHIHQINVSSLMSGTYFLRIITSKHSTELTFIKD